MRPDTKPSPGRLPHAHRAENAPGRRHNRDGGPSALKTPGLRPPPWVALLTAALLASPWLPRPPKAAPDQANRFLRARNGAQPHPRNRSPHSRPPTRSTATSRPVGAARSAPTTGCRSTSAAPPTSAACDPLGQRLRGVATPIQTSLDGKRWHDAYTSTDSRGDHRLLCSSRRRRRATCGWPVDAEDRGLGRVGLRVRTARGTRRGAHQRTRRQRRCGRRCSAQAARRGTLQATGRGAGHAPDSKSRCRAPLPLAGLEVWWGGPRDGATLRDARRSNGAWTTLAEDPGIARRVCPILPRAKRRRLARCGSPPASTARAPVIKRLRLLGPEAGADPDQALRDRRLARASRTVPVVAAPSSRCTGPRSAFLPACRNRSSTNTATSKRSKARRWCRPLARRVRAALRSPTTAQRTHALREGWMPMPSVRMDAAARLQCAAKRSQSSRTGSRSRWCAIASPTAARSRVDGTLSLVRAAAAGQSAVAARRRVADPRRSRSKAPAQRTDVRVNGRVLLSVADRRSMRAAPQRSARTAKPRSRAHVAAGTVPDALQAQRRRRPRRGAADLSRATRARRASRRRARVPARHAAHRYQDRRVAATRRRSIAQRCSARADDAGAGFDALADASRAANGTRASARSACRCPIARWSTCCARKARTC